MREQVELLEDHPDLEPQRLQMRLVGLQLGPGHGDPALVDHLQAVDAAQQRALAGAALADDGDDLARLDLDVDALEDLVVAEALLYFSD